MYSENMLAINKKINAWPIEKQEEFRKVLSEYFYDRTWCEMHGINYARLSDEDILHAKEALYNEMSRNLED